MSYAALAAAWMISELLLLLLLMVESIRELDLMKRGYLDKCRNVRFQHYTLGDYIGDEAVARVLSQRLEAAFRRFPLSFIVGSKTLNISIHVPLPMFGVSKFDVFIPGNIVAYASMLAPTHIFSHEKPGSSGAIQKFLVYHEAGHSIMSSTGSEAKQQIGIWPFVAFFSLVVVSVSWSILPLILLLLSLSYIIAWGVMLSRVRSTVTLIKEVAADWFALQCMPIEDLLTVDRRYNSFIAPNNDLSSDQIRTRIELFRENLGHVRASRVDQLVLYDQPPDITRYGLVLLPCMLLGLFSSQPSIGQAFYELLELFIAILALSIGIRAYRVRFQAVSSILN